MKRETDPDLANADELARLIHRHSLTRAEVAQLLGTSKIVVDGWLAPPWSKLHRPMKDRDLRLLQWELGEKGMRPRIEDLADEE